VHAEQRDKETWRSQKEETGGKSKRTASESNEPPHCGHLRQGEGEMRVERESVCVKREAERVGERETMWVSASCPDSVTTTTTMKTMTMWMMTMVTMMWMVVVVVVERAVADVVVDSVAPLTPREGVAMSPLAYLVAVAKPRLPDRHPVRAGRVSSSSATAD
jgi:hypothetical protein